jgi:hypothetical protein
MGINMPAKTVDDLIEFNKHVPDEYKVDDVVESYRNYYRGGKKDILVKNLQDFDKIQEKLLIDTNYIYSEQEILYACLRNKKCEFFEFDDWLDLQRGILKLIDQYNESEYKTNRWV